MDGMETTNHRQRIGRWGEETAAQYLISNGYTILDRNVRSAHGEIDLVATKEGLLVFVEVKTRSSHSFAYPEDSVTRRKQAYLLFSAEEYLQAHPGSGDSWQFDVISVVGHPHGEVQIEHFENVIG
jgi:putative endonuclease